MKTAALCVMALLAAAGVARADYQTSYTIPDLGYGQSITNIMMFESNDQFGSTTWAFSTNATGDTTLTNPFPTATPITSSLLMGIVQDLPGDAPGQQHVVLMMDNTAAALSQNIAWGTLFRNTDEDQLIADIELATSGQDGATIQPGQDGVNAFVSGDAINGILDPEGDSVSADFATGGAFTVVAWSDGLILGTGTSAVTYVPSSTPEPASLGILGLGAAGLLGRRRAR